MTTLSLRAAALRFVRIPGLAGLPLLATMAIFGTIGISGCARVHAKAITEMPTLDVPPPPPREVEATEIDPPPPVGLVQEPARSVPPRPPSAPARDQPRPEAPKPDLIKPEQPASEAPKPSDEPSKPATTLQTTPVTAEAAVERGIRATLLRASNDLSRIDYRVLNADARMQYDMAKAFIHQAEEAIRRQNLVFAKTNADKAAALAAQLSPK
ncbi:MAG TPA: hypothetical protein VNZ26_22645 [Vicinamibacterales bacterium]|jgi:hypothetical protein|nr:hypothetical protein [Vicinamibacterales bacterium]